MIDFGQNGSASEQEITALFIKYVPFEPLPGDLARQLKDRVLSEVKTSLKNKQFSMPYAAIALRYKTAKRSEYRPLLWGLIGSVMFVALLVAVLFFGHFLDHIF